MSGIWLWKKLHPDAVAPVCTHPGEDAGFDLTTLHDVNLKHNKVSSIRTGIAIEPNQGWWVQIVGRSSNVKRGIDVIPAVIDGGYRGELFIAATCRSGFTQFRIPAGSRIAQLVPHRIQNITWMEQEELAPSARGDGGFGSSGE